MLGGVAPLLVFTFPVNLESKSPLFNAISGIPLVGDVVKSIGVPIPIYLDENLTGIVIDTEDKAIDIETDFQGRNDGRKPIVSQKPGNNLVTIRMKGKKDSLILSVLLALLDLVFEKVVSQEYTVSYLNGPTSVFGGLLHGFSSNVIADTDLMEMTLMIQKNGQNTTAAAPVATVLPKITGSIPVAGVN